MQKFHRKKNEIVKNLKNRTKTFLEFLDSKKTYSSDLLLDQFQSEMGKGNSDYLIVCNVYEPGSFIHSDIILRMFSEFCFRNIDYKTLSEYRTMQLLNYLQDDFDIVIALAFKKIPFSVIEKYLWLNSNVLPRIESDALFGYRVSIDVWYLEVEIKEWVLHKIIPISESEDFRKYKENETNGFGKFRKGLGGNYRDMTRDQREMEKEELVKFEI